MIGSTAKPSSAAAIASSRSASRPSRPNRSASAAQPATAPGHRDRPRARSPRRAPAGRRRAGPGPAASSPCSRSPSQTSANASPPMPVDIGSVTHRIAAAARAASAALPPRSSARRPARVASGWLVATIASAATAGGRAGASREPCGAVASHRRGRPTVLLLHAFPLDCAHVGRDPRLASEEAGYEVARARPARGGSRARLRGLGAPGARPGRRRVRPGRLFDGRLSRLRALAAGSRADRRLWPCRHAGDA